ncbi:MAG: hypothetical protein HY317_01510 [Acidobacteria bacterium]|nr:hypothetical protein [Acidobacteriota bacterium]
METRVAQCANCGAELDVVTQQCPYCAPAADALRPQGSSAAVEPRAAEVGPADERDRALGLALFEAEECLARGAAERAVVLVSKAIKDRPDSLTARALYDRARRELLRGRRREKLESRLREAEGLLERGEFASAERIVGSALKLVPDHAKALELFGRLKDRRLGAGTAEAEAERELLALARSQARQTLAAARTALAAGWSGKAVFALRRGLRLVPDDPELLALLKEVQGSIDSLERERGRRYALGSQVRAGLELLGGGRFDESLRILRAVLREDPDNARAQAAVQEVRRVWLARPGGPRSAPVAAAPDPPPVIALAAIRTPSPASPSPAPRPVPDIAAAARIERRAPTGRSIPQEVLLPRTRRRGTPMGFVLAGAAAVTVGVILVAGRGGPGTRPTPVPSAATPPPTAAAGPMATLAVAPTGPLDAVEPGLRGAIEATVGAYARALERADAALLAQARPDMSAAERHRRLAPFVGALNAATDVRILDVVVRGDEAAVPILSTDVILGGRGSAGTPVSETLLFARRGGAWTLRGAGGRGDP